MRRIFHALWACAHPLRYFARGERPEHVVRERLQRRKTGKRRNSIEGVTSGAFGEELARRKLKMKFAAQDGEFLKAENEHRELQEMVAMANSHAQGSMHGQLLKIRPAKNFLPEPP